MRLLSSLPIPCCFLVSQLCITVLSCTATASSAFRLHRAPPCRGRAVANQVPQLRAKLRDLGLDDQGIRKTLVERRGGPERDRWSWSRWGSFHHEDHEVKDVQFKPPVSGIAFSRSVSMR